MADWLESTCGPPDVILASTAKRVEGTIDGLMSVWSAEMPVLRSEELYLALPERIIATIRRDSLDSLRILVIAHNPGIGELASKFADRQLEYPTAAIAIFDFELSSWTELSIQSQAALVAYGYPKGLGS
jgi:phosphohistidine phosphatase